MEDERWMAPKAVAGGRRGGLKCINGLCRIYPEYQGASLELVSRF